MQAAVTKPRLLRANSTEASRVTRHRAAPSGNGGGPARLQHVAGATATLTEAKISFRCSTAAFTWLRGSTVFQLPLIAAHVFVRAGVGSQLLQTRILFHQLLCFLCLATSMPPYLPPSRRRSCTLTLRARFPGPHRYLASRTSNGCLLIPQSSQPH